MRCDGLGNALYHLFPHCGAVTMLQHRHKWSEGFVLICEACQLSSLSPAQQFCRQLTQRIHSKGSNPAANAHSRFNMTYPSWVCCLLPGGLSAFVADHATLQHIHTVPSRSYADHGSASANTFSQLPTCMYAKRQLSLTDTAAGQVEGHKWTTQRVNKTPRKDTFGR